MAIPSLPRLGMGAAGIGNLYAPVSDEVSRATVTAAWEAGIRFFDTAPHYGFGLSESRLGAALAEVDPAGEAIVSTKVGRLLVPTDSRARERHGFVAAAPLEPVFDYSRDAILRSYEESLARLRRDRVDILLAHDLGTLTHGEGSARHMRDFLEGGYAAMRSLRDSGDVDAIGIGVNETAVCIELLDRVELDVILLAGRYTLLDQSAAERLFPLCLERGVQVIAGGPYNSGILAQSTKVVCDLRYDYAVPPQPILRRAEAIERVCERWGVPLPAAALQFPLRHPAVGSVIPGLVGKDQVAATTERLSWAMPAGLWEDLQEEGLLAADAPAGQGQRTK